MGENQPWDGRNTHFPAVYGHSYSAYDAYSVYSAYAAYSAHSAYFAHPAYSAYSRIAQFTDGSELREHAYFADAPDGVQLR